ncbi:MAG: alpha/beta fold hydrolase [Chitinophagales bacterium]|nr:alpha/beta fold hydrolase [Chitinophagales bacterium]
MDHSYILEMENGRIMVRTRGSGPHLLLALHGYGDQSLLFERLVPELCAGYLVVAIDLPQHGQTEWRKACFDKKDLLEIVSLLQQKHPHQNISLLGFSMGARLWLSLLPDCSLSVTELILLAPDGIKTRGLRIVETFPISVRSWLLQRIRMNKLLAKGLITLGKQSWLPDSIRHFTARHFRNPQKLERALVWWEYLGGFPVQKQGVRQWAQQSGTRIKVWLGEQDPLLREEDLQLFWGAAALDIMVIPGAGHMVGFYKR